MSYPTNGTASNFREAAFTDSSELVAPGGFGERIAQDLPSFSAAIFGYKSANIFYFHALRPKNRIFLSSI
jgi:hypothetical protein